MERIYFDTKKECLEFIKNKRAKYRIYFDAETMKYYLIKIKRKSFWEKFWD